MRKLLLFGLTVLILSSCSKKNNSSNTNPGTNNPVNSLNDNEKLVLGTWKLIRIVDSNYNGTTLNDVQDGVPLACAADNIYTFNDNSKYIVNEGVDTCVSGNRAGEFEWSIDDDYFDYKHGPGLMYADGRFRKIDNNNFAVWSHNYLWNNQNTIKTYYYQRQ